jgi:hypothetical protein
MMAITAKSSIRVKAQRRRRLDLQGLLLNTAPQFPFHIIGSEGIYQTQGKWNAAIPATRKAFRTFVLTLGQLASLTMVRRNNRQRWRLFRQFVPCLP